MEDSLPETVSPSDLREEGGGKMGCAWWKRSVSVGLSKPIYPTDSSFWNIVQTGIWGAGDEKAIARAEERAEVATGEPARPGTEAFLPSMALQIGPLFVSEPWSHAFFPP